MNECERIENSIARWLDGELGAAENESVRHHVTGCANCEAARQRMEKLNSALNSVLIMGAPKIEFTPFWRELEQRIGAKTPWHKELLERVQHWGSTPRVAWGVPALVAVLLAVFSFDSYFSTSRSRNNLATVESIDSFGRNVAMLREDESKTTVIWLYQNQEGDDEVAEETPQPGPAF